MEFTKIEGVACETCGKIHNINSQNFISFHGNVTIGKGNGVYGDKDNSKITVLCRNTKCMSTLIKLINNDDELDNSNIVVDDDVDLTGIAPDKSEEKKVVLETKESFTNIDNNKKAFDPENFK